MTPGRYADRLTRAAAVASWTLRALAAESRSPLFDSPERLITASESCG
ncbi:hypothetical protein ACFXB3_07705 [Streptomyces sp. NPDC059447]